MTTQLDARTPPAPTSGAPRVFRNWIDGGWREAASGRTFENRNPAHRDQVLGLFPRSSAHDVHAAVESARKGFEAWSRVPAPQRGEVLKRWAICWSSERTAWPA